MQIRKNILSKPRKYSESNSNKLPSLYYSHKSCQSLAKLENPLNKIRMENQATHFLKVPMERNE
jgi:hypothetical protein